MALRTLPVFVQDKSFKKDDIVTADFTVKDFTDISAYQFAILFKATGLTPQGVIIPEDNPLGLSETGNFGFYQVAKGNIRTLWSKVGGMAIPDDTLIFSLKFKALKDSTLKSELSLSKCCLNPPLNPMCYHHPLTYGPLTLTFLPIPTA